MILSSLFQYFVENNYCLYLDFQWVTGVFSAHINIPYDIHSFFDYNPTQYLRAISLDILDIFRRLITSDTMVCFLALLERYVLRKKCPYSELLWSVSVVSKHGDILCVSPYSVRMRGNTHQNNSDYGHFSRSDGIWS